jgi:hypothetical protein
LWVSALENPGVPWRFTELHVKIEAIGFSWISN